MSDPVTLTFTNSDARPKVSEVRCDRDSIPQIMAWYGAYFAGDRYTVHADGVKLTKDINGELVVARAASTPSLNAEIAGMNQGEGM